MSTQEADFGRTLEYRYLVDGRVEDTQTHASDVTACQYANAVVRNRRPHWLGKTIRVEAHVDATDEWRRVDDVPPPPID